MPTPSSRTSSINAKAAEGRRLAFNAIRIWIVLFVIVMAYFLWSMFSEGIYDTASIMVGFLPLLIVLAIACFLAWGIHKGYVLVGIVAAGLCLLQLFSLIHFFSGSPIQMVEDIVLTLLSIMVVRGVYLWIRHKDEETSGH